jgi:hypothetical protein
VAHNVNDASQCHLEYSSVLKRVALEPKQETSDRNIPLSAVAIRDEIDLIPTLSTWIRVSQVSHMVQLAVDRQTLSWVDKMKSERLELSLRSNNY